MKTFRFRAELLSDVVKFFALMKKKDKQIIKHFSIHSVDSELPDVVVDIQSEWPLAGLKECIGLMPDSHVMKETLEEIQNYTGER